MTKEKAIKHLGRAREHLNFWREKYVEACRDRRSAMDIKMHYFDELTLREQMKRDALNEIAEAKERIARFERIAI